MAIIKPNNNTLSSITALPASITTGKILQVVQGTHASEDNFGNTSFQASETDVDITPSATSSKVLVTVSFTLYMATMNDEYVVTLYRDSTNLATNAASGFGTIKLDSAAKYGSNVSFQFLDSPNSTSQLHYEMYIKRDSGSGNAILNFNTNATSTITAIEIGA